MSFTLSLLPLVLALLLVLVLVFKLKLNLKDQIQILYGLHFQVRTQQVGRRRVACTQPVAPP